MTPLSGRYVSASADAVKARKRRDVAMQVELWVLGVRLFVRDLLALGRPYTVEYRRPESRHHGLHHDLHDHAAVTDLRELGIELLRPLVAGSHVLQIKRVYPGRTEDGVSTNGGTLTTSIVSLHSAPTTADATRLDAMRPDDFLVRIQEDDVLLVVPYKNPLVRQRILCECNHALDQQQPPNSTSTPFTLTFVRMDRVVQVDPMRQLAQCHVVTKLQRLVTHHQELQRKHEQLLTSHRFDDRATRRRLRCTKRLLSYCGHMRTRLDRECMQQLRFQIAAQTQPWFVDQLSPQRWWSDSETELDEVEMEIDSEESLVGTQRLGGVEMDRQASWSRPADRETLCAMPTQQEDKENQEEKTHENGDTHLSHTGSKRPLQELPVHVETPSAEQHQQHQRQRQLQRRRLDASQSAAPLLFTDETDSASPSSVFSTTSAETTHYRFDGGGAMEPSLTAYTTLVLMLVRDGDAVRAALDGCWDLEMARQTVRVGGDCLEVVRTIAYRDVADMHECELRGLGGNLFIFTENRSLALAAQHARTVLFKWISAMRRDWLQIVTTYNAILIKRHCRDRAAWLEVAQQTRRDLAVRLFVQDTSTCTGDSQYEHAITVQSLVAVRETHASLREAREAANAGFCDLIETIKNNVGAKVEPATTQSYYTVDDTRMLLRALLDPDQARPVEKTINQLQEDVAHSPNGMDVELQIAGVTIHRELEVAPLPIGAEHRARVGLLHWSGEHAAQTAHGAEMGVLSQLRYQVATWRCMFEKLLDHLRLHFRYSQSLHNRDAYRHAIDEWSRVRYIDGHRPSTETKFKVEARIFGLLVAVGEDWIRDGARYIAGRDATAFLSELLERSPLCNESTKTSRVPRLDHTRRSLESSSNSEPERPEASSCQSDHAACETVVEAEVVLVQLDDASTRMQLRFHAYETLVKLLVRDLDSVVTKLSEQLEVATTNVAVKTFSFADDLQVVQAIVFDSETDKYQCKYQGFNGSLAISTTNASRETAVRLARSELWAWIASHRNWWCKLANVHQAQAQVARASFSSSPSPPAAPIPSDDTQPNTHANRNRRTRGHPHSGRRRLAADSSRYCDDLFVAKCLAGDAVAELLLWINHNNPQRSTSRQRSE